MIGEDRVGVTESCAPDPRRGPANHELAGHRVRRRPKQVDDMCWLSTHMMTIYDYTTFVSKSQYFASINVDFHPGMCYSDQSHYMSW